MSKGTLNIDDYGDLTSIRLSELQAIGEQLSQPKALSLIYQAAEAGNPEVIMAIVNTRWEEMLKEESPDVVGEFNFFARLGAERGIVDCQLKLAARLSADADIEQAANRPYSHLNEEAQRWFDEANRLRGCESAQLEALWEKSQSSKEEVTESTNDINNEHLDKNSELYFDRNGLDEEVVEHLWWIPLATVYGEKGQPKMSKTNRGTFNQLMNQYKHLSSEEVSQLYQAGIRELEERMYSELFIGVNKDLDTPVVLTRLPDRIVKNSPTLSTAYSMAFVIDEQHMSLSTKNLMKHYGYPKADAAAFCRNIRRSNMFAGSDKIRLVKPDAKPYYRNVYIFNQAPYRYLWSYSNNVDEKLIVQYEAEGNHEKVLELTDRPLPSLSLEAWKDITKRRFKRLNPEANWNEISTQKQKRLLVNCMRHNSVSYEESWRQVDRENNQHLHDVSFDRTLRKIIRLYPYLADECRRQLDERRIPDKRELY